MNINFELYRIFYTVANHGNITKAAEELMISQPAISKQIKNLEEQLGGVLFVRTKRGVVLTDEGKEFYYFIKQAMDYIGNAEKKFTDLINLEVGSIRIGVSTTLTKEFLLPFLKEFNARYPKINIQILTYLTDDLILRLRNGLLDIVVLNLPYKTDKDIKVTKIKPIHDCFVVNEKYKDLVGKKLKLEELKNYPLVLLAKGSVTRNFIDNFAKENNINLKPNMEFASYGLVIEFIRHGLGIGTAIKEYIEKDLAEKKLFVLDVEPGFPVRHIGIAISNNHLPSFSTKKLIEIIEKK